jgi:CubicO group peptidase (beta-lactamase class C family)
LSRHARRSAAVDGETFETRCYSRPVVDVQGTVDPRFEAVRDAFEQNFKAHGEVGAACCVYHEGRTVVDLWGGSADAHGERPWQRDTLQLAFSASKGVTAICAHMLVETGRLELDAPVARYWPEFAANGKANITVRQVLSHRAGLAMIEGELTLEQVLAWDPVVEAIAAQSTNWEPDSAHGYHVRSYGWIVGELVRRITGVDISRFLRKEIADPLDLDFFIGLPETELHRCAETIPPESGLDALAEALGADSLTARALRGPSNLFSYDQMWNRRELLTACMPSSNGVGTAHSLARLYAATGGAVDGVRILAPATVEAARAVHSDGPDKVILVPSRYGLGFMLPPTLARACSEGAFGHPGAGGSLGFADPEARLGFGYVMNRMHLGAEPDPRAHTLVKATRRCLAGA